jgi:hypothetical protein
MVSILQSWCLHLTLRTQCSTNLSLPSSSSFYGSPVPPAKAQTSHHSLCDLAADTSPALCCLLSLLTPGSSEFQFAVPPHRSLFSMLWNPVPRRPPPGGPPCPEGCVRAPLGAPPSLPAHSRLSLSGDGSVSHTEPGVPGGHSQGWLNHYCVPSSKHRAGTRAWVLNRKGRKEGG